MRFPLLFVALSFLLASCWPTSVSFKDKGSMDARWQKFYVTTLESNAPTAALYYPSRLTEDLKDGIQNNTRLKLGTNKDSCQVVIEGIIVGYNVSPAAIQQGDNAAKSRLNVSVKFTIFNNVTPKEGEIVEEVMEMTATRFVDFSANDDFTSVEASLIEEINKQIVQDVINKLMSNW
ncbi:MAG: hypothetical protein J0G96_08420 [Flavobacteriia bacterium]|nr:hypothetical protein [Flavobacteriia bacterium]OJX36223.1 MAG: hypothetical protein BGO87_07110 [Flavobacteriia bacterium 40-80]